MGGNMLRPMDDVVNAIGKEVWYHELLDWLHWDDHYWAVPMTWGTDMFLYRKDLAQEKGLTQFKTWDDWLKYAQATNDAPKRYGCTLAGNASLWFNEDVYEFVGSNGGHLWDDEGNPTFTNDAVYGTLEFYKHQEAYMPQGWLSHGYVETLNNWATERRPAYAAGAVPSVTSASMPRKTGKTRTSLRPLPCPLGRTVTRVDAVERRRLCDL